MKKNFLLLATAALLFAGCEQTQKAKESNPATSKPSEASKDMSATMDKAKVARTEREKSSDTLALPYKELEQYLPASVAGYTPGELTGQSQQSTGMSMSTAGCTYTKGPGEDIEVSLVDYKGATSIYQDAVTMMGMGIKGEDDEQITGPTAVKADGVKGLDTFHKKEERAEMVLAVGGRFLLTLNAGKQKDMALLKSVAESMDLGKLAKL